MAEYIDIDAPIDFRVYQGRSAARATSSLRELFEKNDARWTAADVRENKRGKWVWNDQSKLVCSLCGNVVAFVSHPKKKWEAGYFCPNCGADMREET